MRDCGKADCCLKRQGRLLPRASRQDCCLELTMLPVASCVRAPVRASAGSAASLARQRPPCEACLCDEIRELTKRGKRSNVLARTRGVRPALLSVCACVRVHARVH
eukprot:1615727-Pleurochrysis_carterae.AAC.1